MSINGVFPFRRARIIHLRTFRMTYARVDMVDALQCL